MRLTFFGAAQSVTGSKHLITLENGKRILLDCGMTQGRVSEKSNSAFPFGASSIHCLVLSHAHIDHSGLIPLLVKNGFAGKIYCTGPTLALASLILEDSAKIQRSKQGAEEDASQGLYTSADVKNALALFEILPYGESREIAPGATLMFTDAGHILGSAVSNLEIREGQLLKTLCFTGDLGRYCNRILRSPAGCPQAQYIICESTYGDKLHQCVDDSEQRLETLVKEVCVEKKGKLLIPAFSLGRTQELIYSFNKLAEAGRLPEVPIFVDSPLSVYATDVVRQHAEFFNDDMKEYIRTDPDPFGFPQLKYISEAGHSKLIDASSDPCVIIASSGMMEGGRIRNHLKSNISDPKNTILITGYCEPATLGGKLSQGAKRVFIDEQSYTVDADIQFMKEYSAHADYSDILGFLDAQDPQKVKGVFLVHGEKGSMIQLKEKLVGHGFGTVEMPRFRSSYHL